MNYIYLIKNMFVIGVELNLVGCVSEQKLFYLILYS